ncbi:AraC family transcriptional regulator [uncultured Kriegella sp.]|uniref:AraC family transcriptional regulator n=1 Tax=uncultured Kriegella sp. TaxID=1798910 RepID=UPI0030D95C3E|tara:strand:+ start:175941 stop:176984 length:1044 start_codon:yes stop_codon:yes gene_type:complete
MKQRLKKQGKEQYPQKNIISEKFFYDSFIGNSVQYDIVESYTKEGRMVVSGSTFSDKVMPVGKRFEMGVSSDCPILKLHFSLEGGGSFESLTADGASIHIPENYCNMFYLPILEGRDIFLNEKIKIFEIYVAHDYLRHLLYAEFEESFGKLHSAMANSKPFVLWEKSKPIAPSMIQKINEIVQCPYSGQVRQRYLESKLTVLLIDFFLGKQTSKVLKGDVKIPKSDYLALVKVEGYIRKNLKKPLSIMDLAEVAGFNATKLKRDFKRVYGITIFKHITALRMEEAKKMITQDGTSIAQAAYEVGYSNPQHFTTAFKRTMGYLPSHLKQVIYSICSLFLEIPASLIGL